jgi:hypothetical protein
MAKDTVMGIGDGFGSGGAAEVVAAGSPALRRTDSAHSALVGAGGRMVGGL